MIVPNFLHKFCFGRMPQAWRKRLNEIIVAADKNPSLKPLKATASMFLAEWGERANDLGWCGDDLFGEGPPQFPACDGLLPSLAMMHGRVICLTNTAALIGFRGSDKRVVYWSEDDTLAVFHIDGGTLIVTCTDDGGLSGS